MHPGPSAAGFASLIISLHRDIRAHEPALHTPCAPIGDPPNPCCHHTIETMNGRMPERWRTLGEWWRSLLLAVAIIAVVHAVVVRFVVVENISMYATLKPGDLLMVERWPVWTGFHRGAVVVFHDPLKDGTSPWRRPLMVKRIAGMPGDRVQLERSLMKVDGVAVPAPPQATRAHLVRLRAGADGTEVRHLLDLPGLSGVGVRSVLEAPLNDSLAALVRNLPGVLEVTPMRPAKGAPRHIFPFSERFAWNGDNYGPIAVPRRGDTLHVDVSNLPLYDRLLTVYEGQRISHSGDTLLLGGRPLGSYVVKQNYYFVLGDGLHNSSDSRYWGFVPENHLVGRARWVITGVGSNGERSGPRRLW
jgi:signal peptidase I